MEDTGADTEVASEADTDIEADITATVIALTEEAFTVAAVAVSADFWQC